MKILITGVAGFIGSQLANSLINLKHNVIGVDNLETGNVTNIQKHFCNGNFKFYQKSILEEEQLIEIFMNENIEIVAHLAALPRVNYSFLNPIKSANTNIIGTLKLLKIANQFGIKKFIFSSSSSIYGEQNCNSLEEDMVPEPISPYGIQKLTSESFCKMYFKKFGLKTICLRYFNVYGGYYLPDDPIQYCAIPKFIMALQKQIEPVIYNSGRQIRDFTYIEDIVNANLRAILTCNVNIYGEAINIGSGIGYSINDLLANICRIMNVSSLSCKYETSSNQEPTKVIANNSKARRLLDWHPLKSLEQGLNETISFYNDLL